MRNVSIIAAVEVGVRELSCERVSDSSLRLVWGEVSEGSDSVVGYRVEVQEIRHQPNSRELATVPLAEEFDRVIEETSAVVTQGLGMTTSTQQTIFSFTVYLVPSVPYEVSVTPVNSAGCGAVTEELTCFTREGSKLGLHVIQ